MNRPTHERINPLTSSRNVPVTALLWLCCLLATLTVRGGDSRTGSHDLKTPASKSDGWSLRPLSIPEVPWVAGLPQATNPIDSFIVDKLRANGLRPSPEADRRTLIRRLHFDLHGLPPGPDDIERFIGDGDPKAYEHMVDRLLASPRYGERWARHWLDVVHYGETHGYDKDQPRPNAWPYRDYVIRSLNRDKPYWRFIQEQVAGDVLFPGTRDGFEALGFLAAGPWDLIGHVEVPETKTDGKVARHLDRDDMAVNTLQTFNSITVQCAQCHDHTFDPVSQEAYYRIQAVFAAVDRADKQIDLDPEVAARRRDLGSRGADLQRRKKELEATFAAGKNQPPPDVSATQLRREELAVVESELSVVKNLIWELPAPLTAYVAAVHTGSGAFVGTGAQGGAPRPIHVLGRGNVLKPGKAVGPGALECLPGLPATFDLPQGHKEGDRRAALARWLSSTRNVLTWRSVVNRVWQYHFGRGLVETPNDFGRMGASPSHPELLDWLAARFLADGQSLKALHKLMVTSATYRQVSTCDADDPRALIDTENRYLWRSNRRKLEAEAIRDAVLLVSGRLDPTMGGPSFKDFVIEHPEHSPHYQYHLHDPDDPRTHRRSIYRFIVRSQQEPFMTVLDCADPSMQVARRNESTSPLQALSLLNNGLMVTMAKHSAEKIRKRGGDLPGQVRLAFYEAIGRPPTRAEEGFFMSFTEKHGLTHLCRVLFNLNEFAFVD